MRSSSHFHFSSLAALALACAVGCQDDTDARGESGALASLDHPDDAEVGDAGSLDGGSPGTVMSDAGSDASTAPISPGLDGGIVPDPNGAYYVSVTANGTGCPDGTTSTSIDPDGKSFTVAFAAYEVAINMLTPDLTLTKNCVLSIKLHSPKGMSYAVSFFEYTGYAFLEQGVTATVSAYYRFQGSAITPNTNRVTKVGPYDQDFIYRDNVRTADLVWSPCGVDRELIVSTQLQLRNSDPKRSGYINFTEFPSKSGIKLAFQPCNASTPPPVLPGAGIPK